MDLSPIGTLTSLLTLHLTGNPAEDITPLASLDNLNYFEYLDVYNAHLEPNSSVLDEFASRMSPYAFNVNPRGWYKEGVDTWYYFEPTRGAMKTGWLPDGGKWYYLNADGVMHRGWKYSGGKWYYMDYTGAMQVGWEYVNRAWYYLKSDGAMLTGWLKEGTKWYYLKSNGAMMANGWLKVGTKWYYFYSSGQMAVNTKIGSYRVGKDGARL